MKEPSDCLRGLLVFDVRWNIDFIELMLKVSAAEITPTQMQSLCNQKIFRETPFLRDAFEEMCGICDVPVVSNSSGYLLMMFEDLRHRECVRDWLIMQCLTGASEAIDNMEKHLFPLGKKDQAAA